MNINDAIRSFVLQNLSFRGSPEELTGSYPLMAKEAIDSMGILQIIGFVEDEFGIDLDDDDLSVENFATLDAISELVERKRSSA